VRYRLTFLCMIAPLCGAPAAVADMPPKLAVIGTIPGPDGGWDCASVDSDARRLYVAHGDAVMEVDLDTGKVNPRLVEGKRLHAVAPLPDGKALSTNGGDDTATLFDAATGKVIAQIPTGKGPDFATYDPSSGLALVMNGRDGNITLIDPKSAKAVGAVDVGGRLEFATIDGHGRTYVNVADRGEIAVVDIAARKLATRYALPGCDEPTGLAIDPDSGVLVAACRDKTAIAMQSKDGKVLATLPIGERPDTVIFDAARKLFFIPCGEGNLAVIAENPGGAPAVIGTIPTASGARTGALDAKTGKLYLPTADFEAAPEGKKRHPVIPGTFRIVVVGEK
jgi:YVTN family beta-propeller protein